MGRMLSKDVQYDAKMVQKPGQCIHRILMFEGSMRSICERSYGQVDALKNGPEAGFAVEEIERRIHRDPQDVDRTPTKSFFEQR
jgi:hypothetical protein